MSFEIGKEGIGSINFTIKLDEISAEVRMLQPYEHKPEFYRERERIGRIFSAHVFSGNTVELFYGSYSGETMAQLKGVVDVLHDLSIIDICRHDEIIKNLEDMVARVKIENEQETAKFAPLLADFKTNVADLYERAQPSMHFCKSNRLIIDSSIDRLGYLISEVFRYRGNPMKVGSRWVYLFLCEGALENLIKSSNAEVCEVSTERLIALQRGVTAFLKKHEDELHAVIKTKITSDADWFQRLYADYISTIESGKPPSAECFGPLTNMDLGKLQLFLPSRFAKNNYVCHEITNGSWEELGAPKIRT